MDDCRIEASLDSPSRGAVVGKRTCGFGALEAVIALALLSVVSFMAVQLFGSLSRGNQRLRSSSDIQDLTNHLRLALRNEVLCNCNLTPVSSPRSFAASAVGSAAPPSFSLTEIRLFGAGCSAGAEIAKVSTAPSAQSGVWVQDMKLENFFQVDGTHYAANLNLKFQESAGLPISRTIPLLLGTITTAGTVTLAKCEASVSSGGVMVPFSCTGANCGGGNIWSCPHSGMTPNQFCVSQGYARAGSACTGTNPAGWVFQGSIISNNGYCGGQMLISCHYGSNRYYPPSAIECL